MVLDNYVVVTDTSVTDIALGMAMYYSNRLYFTTRSAAGETIHRMYIVDATTLGLVGSF